MDDESMQSLCPKSSSFTWLGVLAKISCSLGCSSDPVTQNTEARNEQLLSAFIGRSFKGGVSEVNCCVADEKMLMFEIEGICYK
jgi:hypothetical protein